MKTVSNTSPIIFLSKIDFLDVFVTCFDEIYIPNAVKIELKNLKLPSAIKIKPISNLGKSFVKGALGRLHQGELEAIVLAQELQTDYVLLDDLLARRKAQRMELNIMGTIGVLLLARKKEIVTSKDVQSALEQLIQKHGLYISPQLLNKIKLTLQTT